MLHELLFALHGFPGDICKQMETAQISADNLSVQNVKLIFENLPFIAPSETSLISQLLLIGVDYLRLQKFIDTFTIPGKGLYITALAYGFDNILDTYRSMIREIESKLLQDSSLGLTYIYSKIYSFKPILSSLIMLLEKVMKQLSPCKEDDSTQSIPLLDLVIQVSNSSCSSAKQALRLIASGLLNVLRYQLSTWLIYGELSDPHCEFFIQLLDEEQEFGLSVHKLPSIISPSLANDILLAGQAVYRESLQINNKENDGSALSDRLEQHFGHRFLIPSEKVDINLSDSWELSLRPIVETDSLLILVKEICSFVSTKVWKHMLNKYNLIYYLTQIRDILLLGRGELFLIFFDNLSVQRDRKSSNITSRGCKDIQPDVSQIQCDLLSRPPPSNALEAKGLEYTVNNAFITAARAIGLDDEALEKEFKFTVLTKNYDGELRETAWDCLRLNFIPPDGLKKIFNQSALDAYSRLFTFLLTVRRTEQVLHHYWASETTVSRSNRQSLMQKNCEKLELVNTSNQRMLLRNQMAFIVDHLNCYLQVDVIASQFNRLLQRCNNVTLQNSIEGLHETYLAGLQAQALLFHPIITPCLTRLLAVCRQFTQTEKMSTNYASGDSAECSDTVRLLTLQTDFEHYSNTLFTSLSTAQSASSHGVGIGFADLDGYSVSGGHIAQLLLRLDFNRFFTKYKEQKFV